MIFFFFYITLDSVLFVYNFFLHFRHTTLRHTVYIIILQCLSCRGLNKTLIIIAFQSATSQFDRFERNHNYFKALLSPLIIFNITRSFIFVLIIIIVIIFFNHGNAYYSAESYISFIWKSCDYWSYRTVFRSAVF